MNTYPKTDAKIEEAYKHYKPYMNNDSVCKDLHMMCKEHNCPDYTGQNHDYSACKEKHCFRHYLAYAYLTWAEAWD